MTSVNERRGALKRRSPKTEAAPAHAEPAPEPSPESEEIVLFSEEEMAQLMILDEVHSPVLAEYWRNDSDDDLIADP